MTTCRLAAVVGVLIVMSAESNAFTPPPEPKQPFNYPKAPKANVIDDYHGTKVADPYRPLEDPDAPETKAWIEAENKITFAYLESIPARARIKERLTKLWNYEKFGIPFREGNRYFFFRNSGLQNQSVLYTADSLDGESRVLLDPNLLAADGTSALSGMSVSRNGKHLAYSVAKSGSDWVEWKVRDVATGKDLDDHLKWVKFSGASWTKDDAGFYYSKFPEPAAGADLKGANYHQKLFYHELGTPQSRDRLVYERPDHKEWMIHGAVSDDGRYLIVTIRKSSDDKNRLLYRDLAVADSSFVELIDAFDHEYSFIDNDGPVFYVRTNRDAPRGRIVSIDVSKGRDAAWREVVPQAAETLDGVGLVNDRFILSYLKDARAQVKLFDLAGKPLGELGLPGLGTVAGFGGKRSDRETFYSFTSYTSPTTIYRYEPETGAASVFKRPKVDFNPEEYESEQVFYRSKDGTTVPMIISRKKGLKQDRSNPTLLYGYGGFNNSLTPTFSVSYLVWMEMGGIVAIPNLRGGGEYGEEWHQAGTKLKKQNVFDDFIAAAEWLIENRHTSTPKLAIMGGSNGGLLVGACLNQRPDLFGAGLPAVGVMDMLRFHKFTIGWAWVDDYGSSDDPEQFQALRKYSPYHNLKPGTSYPPTLVTTADHDDRVVPGHSFKYAAALQAAQSGAAPVLIRVETKAGHGAGKPTTKLIEEAADKWAFLVRSLGMDEPAAGR